MTVQPELLRRPVTGIGNQRNDSEQQFFEWLISHGYEVEGWECEKFFLPGCAELDRKDSWLMPDCKLTSGIFLEHTLADEILRPSQLSKLIRQRNRAKESGKDWISPQEYLHKKSTRIALAESLYGITIVLLPTMIRRTLMRNSTSLDELIVWRRSDPADYDEDLFSQLPELPQELLALPA
jgi:hypothetical protein